MTTPILSLNAFDMHAAAGLPGPLADSLARRARLFGAASMLFYDEPLEIVRGEGCWLFDSQGTAYLDAYNNVPSVGHCHPRVVEAVTRQLRLLNVHNRYLHPGILGYAERLLSTMPGELSNITFTCTGSESNDLALRLASGFTGGAGVIVTAAAYHGNTSLVTEISPGSYRHGAPPAHVRVIPAPDSFRVPAASLSASFAADVASAIADLTAKGVKFSALVVDSIFSSDGVCADPPGFLRAAVDLVHRAGGLFVADEVQPGFGRTGSALWGFERHGVRPDIVTLGKPMGNGYPIAAAITRPEILETFCRQVGYFNTFGGSPVAAAAGLAVLEVLEEEGLMDNAVRVGAHLQGSIAGLAARHPSIGDVRGAGFYLGIELVEPGTTAPAAQLAPRVINAMRRRRVLIGAAGRDGNVLKLRPPLCFSAADAGLLVTALDESLAEAVRDGR